ncbi:MAG: 30S ribosomal protein S2 [Parcubacteria group bacterium GW2011_GWB1_46_8]|nr:MAG: 30S ribosomal protein S2 [Parcubacteria group bacterium GW2011_GWF1_45_5]KKU43560.1 MAG: 30S ribosomal protein S2 [Parcubacteria group bacterium GW2011_GWA2_46_7]KKU46644.1 MAG: 30S ribosomal protein S2 [Parcubacteria group bacterium GW2011_GWB1_46_8]KKU47790.1 MAG: 30S ribosomal protein S2 [Parcubacteria group bacterium GW2011_GWF2_46_8]
MIDAGMHIGVRRFLVHPRMRPFIFTYKEDLALINLAKTVELWEKMFQELRTLIAAKKTILFLGTQPAAKKLLAQYGEELELPYMTQRWLGGTLTNFSTFRARLDHLKDLQAKASSPEFAKYTKKEQGQMVEEANEIKKKFDGLTRLSVLPDALFVFCGRKHRTAIMEAKRVGIPVFGIFGLDDNFEDATHCIVINDNAQSALALVIGEVRSLYQELRAIPSVTEKADVPATQAKEEK